MRQELWVGEVVEFRLGEEPGNEWVYAEITAPLRATTNGEGGFYELMLLTEWSVRDIDRWDGHPYKPKFPAGFGFSAKPDLVRPLPELHQERLL